MTLNEYQVQARRTANTVLPVEARMTNWALGLCGEVGELADHIKKHVFHGHDLDMGAVVKELGDVLWYVSQLAAELGISLEEVARRNIEKLAARYPEGFDPERSVNRVE